MNSLSAATSRAYWLLRQELYQHLEAAEQLGVDHEEWAGDDIAKAGKLIVDLVTVIRGMLGQHRETSGPTARSVTIAGHARTCSPFMPC